MRKEKKAETAVGSRRDFLLRSSLLPLAGAAMAMPLASCGDGLASSINTPVHPAFRIDSSIASQNQDSRVRALVLHYTAQPLDKSLQLLTEAQYQVSAHYLVPDGPQISKVYQLVPEEARAWHAGISYWQGDRMLNSSTIGMEIVNLGFPTEDESVPPMSRRWYPYPDTQIAVVAQLANAIIARHQISPSKIVGHSDIAPGRKWDPGPLFPWQQLFEQYQIGAWPDAEALRYYASSKPFGGNVAELQSKLLAYGYDTPQSGILDGPTVNVITAFQMHFRPSRYDGVPDVATVAMLDALLENISTGGVLKNRKAILNRVNPIRISEQREATSGRYSTVIDKASSLTCFR